MKHLTFRSDDHITDIGEGDDVAAVELPFLVFGCINLKKGTTLHQNDSLFTVFFFPLLCVTKIFFYNRHLH